MPAKNIVKVYKEDSYYHIYNRGVARQDIFLDDQDYKYFLFYLKLYVIQKLPDIDLQGRTLKYFKSRIPNNFADEIQLVAYCLLPNHYHFLIHQKSRDSIQHFMRSLGTKYSMYFNDRYNRVGPLLQGKYKAVLVDSDEQFVYLSKYIHKNPLDVLTSGSDLEVYKYSSYINYLGRINQTWVKPQSVLDLFSSTNKMLTYKQFVESLKDDYSSIEDIVLDA